MNHTLWKIRRAYKKSKRFLLLVLFRGLLACGRIIPRGRTGAGLGRILGRLCFLLLGRERNRTLANLRTAWPDKDETWIQATARATFINIGLGLLETLTLPYLTDKDMRGFEIRGEENLTNALALGRGAIVLTGHIGNWEAIVCCLIRRGYRGGVIAKKLKTYGYNDLVTSFRARYGVQTIFQRGALRQSLKILRNGGIIGILPDQDIPKQPGVFVPFFGRASYTPTGPALIARASGSPVIPLFIERVGGGFLRHRLTILPALAYAQDPDKDSEVRANTAAWTAAIEDWIRAHPADWVWFHRRWRTAPQPAPRA